MYSHHVYSYMYSPTGTSTDSQPLMVPYSMLFKICPCLPSLLFLPYSEIKESNFSDTI